MSQNPTLVSFIEACDQAEETAAKSFRVISIVECDGGFFITFRSVWRKHRNIYPANAYEVGVCSP